MPKKSRTTTKPRRQLAVITGRRTLPPPQPTRRYRFRPGTVALAEIRRAQKSTKLMIPKKRFEMLVRETVQDHMVDYRWEKKAFEALHEAAEAHLVEVLRRANKLAIHAKRVTLKVEDIRMVLEMMEDEK